MDGANTLGVLERNPWVARRKLDVTEYHRMGAAGILTEEDRVELIEGEIVAMVPIGSDHSSTVARLTRLFVRAAGDRAVVWPQNPVRLSVHSEPQPDVVLLRPREDDYEGRTPGPEDVLLLVEVSGSSLRYDRGVKLPLYAQHGIREVWIVDLAGRAVEVHRDPAGEGYARTTRAVAGEVLEPAALPGLRLAVSDVLRSAPPPGP